jgi:predicted enzyme related to lactoylglutathione lyase
VSENGGSAVGDKIPVADMGTAAYFLDCEGNLMGLWQNAT